MTNLNLVCLSPTSSGTKISGSGARDVPHPDDQRRIVEPQVRALERTDPSARLLSGRVDRIGLEDARWVVAQADGGRAEDRRVDAPDQKAAVRLLIDWLERSVGFAEIAAVGHRVVHGGSRYHQPEPVTAELIEELRKISSYDPDHLPGEIELIEAFRNRDPDLPQVACFDTAFHHDMPRVAQIVPIPRRFEAAGVRRYGFHGLSYAYLMEELARVAGPEEARGRVILAHLGAGASLAAVRGGLSIDTTMGFTPASGLVMGTRTGRPRSGAGPVPVAGRWDDGRPVRQPREPPVRPARRLGDQL